MKFKSHGHFSQKVLGFLHLFFNLYKDHNKECSLTTFEQLSKGSFGGICGKRLTVFAYMNLVSKCATK